MSKIPQVALAFWIMKICATTLGETAGDLMSMTFHLGYAVSTVILMVLLLGVLAIWRVSEGSLSVDRIETRKGEWFYWAVLVGMANRNVKRKIELAG